MSKSFKIARKPGQGSGNNAVAAPTNRTKQKRTQAEKTADVVSAATIVTRPTVGVTTRKTIEVPEDYFYRVKMRALERKILEKELWAEIIGEYFKKYPSA